MQNFSLLASLFAVACESIGYSTMPAHCFDVGMKSAGEDELVSKSGYLVMVVRSSKQAEHEISQADMKSVPFTG